METGGFKYQWTKHALERWSERIGGAAPSPIEIDRLVREAEEIQCGCDLLKLDGRPVRILGVRVHLERGLAFRIDERLRRVVTVIALRGRN